MTDKPEDHTPPADRRLTVLDVHHAPVIYFDGAPNWGIGNGIANITLAFARHLSAPNGVQTDVVACAYLRSSIGALLELRKAIDEIILAASPPATDKVN